MSIGTRFVARIICGTLAGPKFTNSAYCPGRSARWSPPTALRPCVPSRDPDDHGRTSVGRPLSGSISVQIRFDGFWTRKKEMRQPERRANIRREIRGLLGVRTFGATSFRFYAPSAGTGRCSRASVPQSKNRGRRADVPNISGLKSVVAGLMHRQQRAGAAGYGSEPRNDLIAGAQTVFMVERNMSNAPTRALSSRRGRGPHHAHKDLGGPRLTTGHLPTWSASGGRGAVADDAWAREVGLRHSSCEAGDKVEQSATDSGEQGGDQGECGPAKHVPNPEPGKRVTGAETDTANLCRYDPR
jgi:hypothetical protein